MRRNKVTIRELKAKTGITLKRIRLVLNDGIEGTAVRDWVQAVLGEYPGAEFTWEDID